MTAPPPARRSPWRWPKRLALALSLAGLALVAAFGVNGLVLADRETPRGGRYDLDPAPGGPGGREVTVVAYNIAKGFAPIDATTFHDEAWVKARLDRMAEAIRAERPDLVLLSEAMTECGPCPVDQVAYLARACGLPHWAFGENYNFGLPGYRVIGGNAVLARGPLEPVKNVSLAGRRPFFLTSNSRRALFARATLHGQQVLVGSLHNDSYDPANNLKQVEQLLAEAGDEPCLLGGDFNARPGSPSMRRFEQSGRFAGAFNGEPTFPAHAARIDFVLAPAGWAHLGTRVVATDASDHRPVVARFRLGG